MPAATDAKTDKLADRLALILARLHQGETLNKHQLAEQFAVTARTIERDLKRLRDYVEHTPEGWQLSTRARSQSAIPAHYLDAYAVLSGTQHTFPITDRAWMIKQLETAPQHTGLHVHPTPAENNPQLAPHFQQLQQAVQGRHPCRFTYKNKPRQVHPLRLIEKRGIWYLAAAEVPATIDHPKAFSLARIQQLQVETGQRFIPRPEHLQYLDTQDDIWFTSQSTPVRLRISPQAADYFKRLPLLPQQQSWADADGTLTLTCRIHHPQQLLPLVRFWLPHVRIVEPKAWQQQLVDELQAALKIWMDVAEVDDLKRER